MDLLTPQHEVEESKKAPTRATIMAPTRGRRAENYSQAEIRCIIDFYKKNNDILSSKFSSNSTLEKKNKLYDNLLNAVNAVSSTTRTLQGIKDKWQNLQRHVRSKVAAFIRRKTKERNITGMY